MITKEELLIVGGSDAAAIAGIHPAKTALDVYARIVEGVEDPENDAMFTGSVLEDPVRKLSVRKYGWESLGPRKLLHPTRPFIRSNLDDILTDRGELLLGEYKTANKWTQDRFGDEGTDDYPREYFCQAQLYFEVLGNLPSTEHTADVSRGWLVAFLGGLELRRYPLRRDREAGKALVEIIERFWVDHVQRRRPPPLGNDDSTSRWLRRKFPENNGQMILATPHHAELAAQLFAAREAGAKAEAIEKAVRVELEKVIQDADGIQGDGWKITYKRASGSLKVDWEAVANELGATPDVVDRHSRISSGSRRFVPTIAKAKK